MERRGRSAIPQGVLVALATVLLLSCTKAPVIVGYRSVRIDPRTLPIEMLQPIPAQFDIDDKGIPVLGSYYTYFVSENRDIFYEHYNGLPTDDERMRFTHMEGGSDWVIHQLTKQQVLLRGAFGTVYADKTCYFGSSANHLNHLWVTAYANSAESESPTVETKEPSPTGALTHVSLVRVFRRPPGYVIVSAVYAASGRIQHLWINASKAGDWIHPSQFPDWSNGFLIFKGDGKQRSTLARFGFPDVIDTQSYIKLPVSPFLSAAPDVQLSVVNLHFDYERWVRQDNFSALGHTTRYLTFTPTYEDSVLETRCAAGFSIHSTHPQP